MSARTIADRRTSLATVPLRFVKDAPSMLLGLPAAYAFISKQNLFDVLAYAGAIAAAVLILYYVRWRRFRYGVGASEIVIESGLLTRTRRSIPFDRIQDVDIERGPLQRLFGLAKVRIETGGGQKDEGLIDSVTLAEADRLRAAVRAGRAGATPADANLPIAAEAPASRTIFAMTVPRVLVAGLFNFSLVYIAGLFGLLQTFKDLLPFDIYDPGRWLGLVDAGLTDQIRSGQVDARAALAVLLVALLVGVVFGVVRTLASDYGFRLAVEGTRLRRTRGLFTRSEIVLAKSRVQLALLTTGPLRKRAGWGALDFQTLSGAAAAGQRQSVAPLASNEEVGIILAEQGTLRLPDMAMLTMVSSRHLIRTFVSKALVPTVAILAAGIAWRPALFALVLTPLLVMAALLERRFHRYALEPDLLFVKRGVWQQKVWMVPVTKAQTVTLSRSFLQRRLGLATVIVDTAGGAAFGGPRIIDLHHDRARDLLGALAERLFRQEVRN